MRDIMIRQILSTIICTGLCLASAVERGVSQQSTKPIDQNTARKNPVNSAKPTPIQIPLHVVASGTAPSVASDKNTIYVVFVSNKKIFLVTSNDGISWTSPRLISGTDVASNPAIRVLDNGNRVITWTLMTAATAPLSHLRYFLEGTCGPVAGPVTFSNLIERYDITSTDNDIHLATGDESSILYASFPADMPETMVAHTVLGAPLCFVNTFLNSPAIAARSTPSGPEVVVALYHYSNEPITTCPQPPHAASILVYKKTGGNWTGIPGGGSYPITNQSLVTATDAFSVSMDVNSHGVYFLAASFIVESVSRVMLARGSSSGMASNVTTLPANFSRVLSVSKRKNQPHDFNLAFTTHHLPANYDETSRQIVGWPPSSAAPFFGGSQFLHTYGKNIRATDIQVCKGANVCLLNSVFERKIGSGNPEIVSDAICVPNAACAAASGSSPADPCKRS
jgi:hypothetical protein